MKPYLLPIIVLLTALPAPQNVFAQGALKPAPVHVAIGKPLTRMTDVLRSLAAQSGAFILADDTVVDTLGVTTIDTPTVDEMLTALVPLGQGMTWQRVYLPQDGPLPDGTSLAAQVRALQGIASMGLVIVDPAFPRTLSFSKSSGVVMTPPAAMRTVYLVTNETVRAQRLAFKKAAEAKPKLGADTGAPVDHAVAGMQTAADDVGRMTPEEQRQALPLLFQQMLRMYQGIDPGVRDEMRQQWQQRRNQGGGNPGR